MKKEYDFSHGERGKFYHPTAVFNLPVYLEPDIAEFVQQRAQAKDMDIQTLVNEWLRKEIELVRSLS